MVLIKVDVRDIPSDDQFNPENCEAKSRILSPYVSFQVVMMRMDAALICDPCRVVDVGDQLALSSHPPGLSSAGIDFDSLPRTPSGTACS